MHPFEDFSENPDFSNHIEAVTLRTNVLPLCGDFEKHSPEFDYSKLLYASRQPDCFTGISLNDVSFFKYHSDRQKRIRAKGG